MRPYSVEEIRRCFATSTDFNEIFDVFQGALAQRVQDLEPYRLLFWNHSLTPDEVRLFGEKLAAEFPVIAYDVYLWLASIFEVTSSTSDNYDLAIRYYRRAAAARPDEVDPYLDACDCYDPDLNIPPLSTLIEFLKQRVGLCQHFADERLNQLVKDSRCAVTGSSAIQCSISAARFSADG
jgi:hypothetical protein